MLPRLIEFHQLVIRKRPLQHLRLCPRSAQPRLDLLLVAENDGHGLLMDRCHDAVRLRRQEGPEILRMAIRDMYHAGGEVSFNAPIKRIEKAAVDSIYTDLRLRGTDEWTEILVKERASNFVTTLLTSFTYDRV